VLFVESVEDQWYGLTMPIPRWSDDGNTYVLGHTKRRMNGRCSHFVRKPALDSLTTFRSALKHSVSSFARIAHWRLRIRANSQPHRRYSGALSITCTSSWRNRSSR